MGHSANARAYQCHNYSQRGSGKSSLIKAAFKVDMSVSIWSYFSFLSIYLTYLPRKQGRASKSA